MTVISAFGGKGPSGQIRGNIAETGDGNEAAVIACLPSRFPKNTGLISHLLS